MAVIVKYVVVRDGKEDMTFTTKQEAEAHDKMLAVAEQLYAVLQTAEINMAEDTLEALSIFMAQHREHIGTILKGGKLKAPAAGRAPQGAVAQEKREEPVSSAPKRSKTSQSTPSTLPQAAA
jgi:dsDNA-binding SOS-regulon protein